MKAWLKSLRDTSPLMEPLCRALRATGLAPRGLWQHLAFTGIADFTVAGSRVKMRHFAAEIENSLFWAGYGQDWEGTTLLAWERLAAEADLVFDVGANTGLFALAACAANPAAEVHAFEPMPAIAARLADNIALNGFAVAIHAAAVSDQPGTAQIKSLASSHEYSASLEHMEWMDSAEVTVIEVPLLRLADVIGQTGRAPDLIKIDVERHEPQALAGLWPGLEGKTLPVMVIEVLDEDTALAVRQQIEPRGYRSFAVREGKGISEAAIRPLNDGMNWLLVPPGAGGFAGALAASGGITHADLLGARPATGRRA